jgi:hypothetical protein
MRNLVSELILQSKKATPKQLAQLIAQASLAPFATDLLEIDEPLWGSFWQGDVIAPGYRLPAVELALLRATRLDQAWPEGTTVAEFLADLHAAISDPQAGVWTLMAAGEPCVVFASVRGQGLGVGGQTASVTGRRSSVAGQPSAISHQPSATVVWYCATTGQLHAGYRTAVDRLNFAGGVVQRPLGFTAGATHFGSASHLESTNWLEQILERDETSGSRRSAACPATNGSAEWVSGHPLAARLDATILHVHHRRG